jgi:hypothetical protein
MESAGAGASASVGASVSVSASASNTKYTTYTKTVCVEHVGLRVALFALHMNT